MCKEFNLSREELTEVSEDDELGLEAEYWFGRLKRFLQKSIKPSDETILEVNTHQS